MLGLKYDKDGITFGNKVFDEILDAIFIIDIVVNFFTLYVEDLEIVTKFYKVIWHYCFEGPFIFDLIATIPTLVTF